MTTEVMFTVAARWMNQTDTLSFSRRPLQVNTMMLTKHCTYKGPSLCICMQPVSPSLYCITDEDDDDEDL
ncbi:hypothetical protein CesoFtcFv8_011080 [Champsocephalus esox]|uniref:Uncharacterized protein n=1 Tax=Champsocephalus esox TaxID=159716 RepID=A0AAN8GXP5_9TELE|nr:hypothetical protein CesoFtcFv8_011080 [Champsocephalus esox]